MIDWTPWDTTPIQMILIVSSILHFVLLLILLLRRRAPFGGMSPAELRSLGERLRGVEGRIASGPQVADVHALVVRVQQVEHTLANVRAEFQWMSRSIGKVERGVEMLVQNAIDKEKRG